MQPINKISKTIVPVLQILQEDGTLNGTPMPKLSQQQIIEMYKTMVLCKVFDDIAVKLQRQGRLGPYVTVRGHEASQVASAFAMKDTDWMFPSYRESAAYIARKVPLKNIFLYWMGDERWAGDKANGNNFPVAIPVSTQIPHAAGAALAAKIKDDSNAMLVYFGDGATSRGDFHEAMNFAGVFKLPIVFLCQNNQYAISVPRSMQTASETIAQKAIAYGFEGIQIDGNDVFAVYSAVKDALDKARTGGGPTLIECVMYRLSDHSTADDAKKYRTQEEVDFWKKKDPVDRLKKFLEQRGSWSGEDEKRLVIECEEKINAAVKEAESFKAPTFEDLFKNTFDEMPWFLKEELEELKKAYDGKMPEVTNKVEKIEGSFP